MLTTQTNLAGRYQIVRAIGAGGFGQTYLATDLHLPNRPLCVVKQFRPHPNQGATIEKLLELFDKEAKALYNLGNHDCIPRLLAHFNEGDEFYLAQEYIEGHTLADELISGGKMHESYTIGLLKDILEVLTFVHQNNVIHRDIKPTNLIRRKSDGKIVLIDFGAVKEVSRGKANQTGMTSSVSIAIGSLGYMPDEQAANKPRYASDIYAVGKIGIQALTGLRPDQLSDDLNTGELVWKHHVEVSPQLGAFIDRMVRSHFRDRYADAVEALVALQSLSTDGDVSLSRYLAPTVVRPSDQAPTQTGLSSNNNDEVTIGVPISPDVARTVAAQHFTNPDPTKVSSRTAKTLVSDVNPTQIVGLPPKSSKLFAINLLPSLVGLTLIGLAGYGAYSWMRDRDFQNAIAEAKSFQLKANYDACLDKLTLIPKDIAQSGEAKSLSLSCYSSQAKEKLATAKGLAKDNKHQEAITIASTINPETSSYAEAKMEINKWSDILLVKATNLYAKNGSLEQAVELAKKIPTNTPAGKQASELVPKWQSAWKSSETNYKEATAASKKQDWKKVVSESKQVADTPYWIQKVSPLRKQAEDKIALLNAPAPAVSAPPVSQAQVYTPPEPVYREPVYTSPEPVYREPVYREPVYTPPEPEPAPAYIPPSQPASDCNSRHC